MEECRESDLPQAENPESRILFQINTKNAVKPKLYGTFEAGEEGLEPPSTVLETAALPLNYSPL